MDTIDFVVNSRHQTSPLSHLVRGPIIERFTALDFFLVCVMRSKRWSESTAMRRSLSVLLAVSCVQLPGRKFQEILPTGCQYLEKKTLLPCVCLDVCSERTTISGPISAARAATETLIYVIHPPLTASKTGLGFHETYS